MITVGIKALNEEATIAEALTHALAAVAPFKGEVMLADSGSTDRTVEIARTFPVRIVQFKNIDERCCGAAAQLAFQDTHTEFFYMQDGDMTLNTAFVAAALARLQRDPDLAGVGGDVLEKHDSNEEFQIRIRSQRAEEHRRPGLVDRLDGGGLYRVKAVRQTGYFADRNLHAFEEFDLAARLHAAGWKLERIDCPAVAHYGHVMGGYRLMWRRVRSGYTAGLGETVRAALRQPHLGFVLTRLKHVRHAAAVIAWWITLGASAAFWLPATLLLLLAPLAFLWTRRGSLRLAVYSAAHWNLSAVGLLTGLLRSRIDPRQPIDRVELTGASIATEAAAQR